MTAQDSGIVERGPVREALRARAGAGTATGNGSGSGSGTIGAAGCAGREALHGARRQIAPVDPAAAASHRVLMSAPTVAAAQRLLDIAGLFDGDSRIQPVFTVPPNVLGRGTRPLLAARGVWLLPWTRAVGERFDLAVATDVDSIAALDASTPVAFFSPGDAHAVAGPCGRGPIPVPGPVIGFTRSELIRAGRLAPAALALAHERELRLVQTQCPEAAGVATVVGDPCYDRIVSSSAHRDAYRAAFGLRKGQKLVVVTSSWRADSLFGSGRPVMERLLDQLPAAEYRVVLLTHPEAWAAYGDEQMAAWFERWERLGLATVGPRADWRPYVAASDFIVGDHESVELFGAAASVPVLLGAFGENAALAGADAWPSAAARPWLSADDPIIAQLARAAARFDPAAAFGAGSEAGGFARRTRRLLYSLLGLSQPPSAAELPAAPRPTALDLLSAASRGLGRAA